MSLFVTLVTGFFAAVVAAAIINRLASDREVPVIIGKGTDALANIFRGVFHG